MLEPLPWLTFCFSQNFKQFRTCLKLSVTLKNNQICNLYHVSEKLLNPKTYLTYMIKSKNISRILPFINGLQPDISVKRFHNNLQN